MLTNPYSIASFLSGMMSATLAVFVWRQNPILKLAAFSGALLAMTFYSVGYGFEVASKNLPTILFWTRVEYLGIAPLPAFWSIVLFQYLGWERWLTRRNLVLLFLIPAITLILIVTNDFHHLFYQTVAIDTTGLNPALIFTRGPWYFMQSAYVYLAYIGGSLALLWRVRKLALPFRSQALALLAGTFIPFSVNSLFILGWLPWKHLDITPFAFTLTSMIITWSVYRHRLLDLVPMAQDTVIENLQVGVLALDEQGRVAYINPMLQRILGLPANLVGFSLASLLDRAGNRGMAQAMAGPLQQDGEIDTELCPDEEAAVYFNLRGASFHNRKGHRQGRVFTLSDISRQKAAESTLYSLATDLETRVSQRTAELKTTVQSLEAEIAARKQAEADLRAVKDHLAERVVESSRKLSALYDLILTGGNLLNLPELLSEALSKILVVVNGQAGCIFLETVVGGQSELFTQNGFPPEIGQKLASLPLDDLVKDNYTFSANRFKDQAGLPADISIPGMEAVQIAPIHLQVRKVGVLAVWWTQPQNFSVDDIALVSTLGDQLGLLMENVQLRERIGTAAAMQERRRLAQDLHDSVTQSLHSLILHADTAINRLRAGKIDRLEQSLTHLRVSACQSLKEMRLLLYELRLKPVEEIHLVEALRIRLEAIEARAGIDARFVVGEPGAWPPAWEIELYSIAMEALNNSLKHAHANQVTISLNGGPNWVEMEIRDNGCGFNSKYKTGGMGLMNMKERAERLGGNLEIVSDLRMGTCIRLQVGSPVAG